MARIHVDRLTVYWDQKLGEGGSTDGLWRCVGPDGLALYKRYDRDAVDGLDIGDLDSATQWPFTLGAVEQSRVREETSWPAHVVVDDHRALGVLIPEAPENMWRQRSGSTRRPRPISALSETVESARSFGTEYYRPPQRMSRLGHLLELICFFHEHDVVLGDLHPGNVLVSGPSTRPLVYLLDCDSVAIGGCFVHPCNDPELWRYPYGSGFTKASDLYKFALITIRCLQSDNAIEQPDRPVLDGLMPEREALLMERMLSPGGDDIDPRELRSAARAWKGSYESNGVLYVRTEEQGWTPWVEPPDTAGRSLHGDANTTAISDDQSRPTTPRPRRRRVGRTVLVVLLLLAVVTVTYLMLHGFAVL